MFYFLSKTIWFIFQPSFLIPFISLIGIFLLWTRFVRLGKILATVGLLSFFLFGLSPLSHLALLSLEERFARPSAETLHVQPPYGIIILGGASDTAILKARGTLALNEASERLIEVISLAKRFPKAKIIFTGGGGGTLSKQPAEAITAKEFFEAAGIDKNRIILENKSRNTYENAIFTKTLMTPQLDKTYLLVTSAFHMPRSMGCFRKAGFKVMPWLVDYRTRGWQDAERFFSSPADGLKRFDVAAKEWVGLLVYWLVGKTDQLFPKSFS